MRLRRPIQTRFRYGYPARVNLATYHNSQAHSSKGTRSLHVSSKADTLPRLVGTRFQVLFHDPSPGHFSPFPHGTCSLSVTREYLGLGGGPPGFTRDFSGPVLLGIPLGSRKGFAYRGITFCADDFHRLRLPTRFLTPCRISSSGQVVPQHRLRNACWLSHVTGLACSPFAHHYSGNRGCFLFLWVLRCFTSPRFLHLPYVFRQGRWAITPNQVSLFGDPRVKVWLPTNRGLSQAPTSFFGSWCQGIHRVPLLTWQLQMMLASTVQFSRYGRSRTCDARGGEGTGPGRGWPLVSNTAAVPSGPNSVLGPLALRTGVPCCVVFLQTQSAV